MQFLKIILIIVLGTYSTPMIILRILFIIGLWKMLQKSGVKSWWALIPCARNYMLAKCADKEERDPGDRQAFYRHFHIDRIHFVHRRVYLFYPCIFRDHRYVRCPKALDHSLDDIRRHRRDDLWIQVQHEPPDESPGNEIRLPVCLFR